MQEDLNRNFTRWLPRLLSSRKRQVLSALTWTVAFMSGCDNTRVLQRLEATSPDGKWAAVGVSEAHSGPGNNDAETRVYLKEAGRFSRDKEVLGLFHNPTLKADAVGLKMEWKGPHELVITYTNHPERYMFVQKLKDVTVRAVESAASTQSNSP